MRTATRIGVYSSYAGWLWLACAACTGSENQLFTPAPLNKPPIGEDASVPEVDAASRDAGTPIDTDSSVLQLNPDLDPDAQFVWVETLPGHAGACEPGTYTGSFECSMAGASGLGRLVGSIELTLAPGADAKQLTLTKGKMTGFAGGTAELFSAQLEGELACGSAEFSATTTDSDVYPFPGFDDEFGASKVQANLNGHFDAEALSIHGDVALTADSGWKCDGPFTVRAAR